MFFSLLIFICRWDLGFFSTRVIHEPRNETSGTGLYVSHKTIFYLYDQKIFDTHLMLFMVPLASSQCHYNNIIV